jgi:hypothetical protein
MNENARKWVEALRSGEFKQAQRKLRRSDGTFCCLGVACELYRRECGEGEWVGVADENYLEFDVSDERTELGLPKSVKDWLGLNSPEGEFKHKRAGRTWLTVKNDQGASFEEIAALIETEPEGLFA